MSDDADAESALSEDGMQEVLSDEAFLTEAEDEAVAATPEVELLNDVTQHYLPSFPAPEDSRRLQNR